jgi:2-C-methyl-D-erythritol 4-phosphate cytidylyltransferase
MEKTYAVIPAAGRGIRMGGDRPKQFLRVCRKPILLHTLDAVSKARFISEIFVVAPADYLGEVNALLETRRAGRCVNPSPGRGTSTGMIADMGSSSCHAHSEAVVADRNGEAAREAILAGPAITVVAGGAERQDSVYNGLMALPRDCVWVLIHDGVRPFVSAKLLDDTWRAAHETGASIAALPATDTVKRVLEGHVVETVPREEMWLVQTPQVFRKDLLLDAYLEARRQGWSGTDDASFVERLGHRVIVVAGERTNIKVTTREDLAWASWLLDRGQQSEVDESPM